MRRRSYGVLIMPWPVVSTDRLGRLSLKGQVSHFVKVGLMLERPPSRPSRRRRSPGALKALEHRQRERDELRCYYVPVHRSVIETLIERGLSPAEAEDPKAVGRELGVVLLQWVERWYREKNNP
jgi:hypothetical protein